MRSGSAATFEPPTIGRGPDRFVTELAWREYYADVLWRRPDSGWEDLRPLTIPYDDPGDAPDRYSAR